MNLIIIFAMLCVFNLDEKRHLLRGVRFGFQGRVPQTRWGTF